MDVLYRFPSLKSLSCPKIVLDPSFELKNLPLNFPCSQSLESLDLHFDQEHGFIERMQQIDASLFIRGLIQVINQFPNLKQLSVDGLSMGNPDQRLQFSAALSGLTKLKYLRLRNLPFTFILSDFTPVMRSLKHVDIEPIEPRTIDIVSLLKNSSKLEILRIVLDLHDQDSQESIMRILHEHKVNNPQFIFCVQSKDNPD